MGADLLVKNAWYVAGLSHEFPPQQLQGQVIAEKPLVMWRTAAGTVAAFDERCCHKRMPLSQGRLIERDLLESRITAGATTQPGGASGCRRIPTAASRRRRGCGRFLSLSRMGWSGCGPATRR